VAELEFDRSDRDAPRGFSPGLELLVEFANRAGNIYSARDTALTILDPFHNARRLPALRTIGALRRVHYLLAICCLGDLSHEKSPSVLGPLSIAATKSFAVHVSRKMDCARVSFEVCPYRLAHRIPVSADALQMEGTTQKDLELAP
jgi:hypothetical protein